MKNKKIIIICLGVVFTGLAGVGLIKLSDSLVRVGKPSTLLVKEERAEPEKKKEVVSEEYHDDGTGSIEDRVVAHTVSIFPNYDGKDYEFLEADGGYYIKFDKWVIYYDSHAIPYKFMKTEPFTSDDKDLLDPNRVGNFTEENGVYCWE